MINVIRIITKTSKIATSWLSDAAFHDILHQLSCDHKMAARRAQRTVHGRRMGGGRSYYKSGGRTTEELCIKQYKRILGGNGREERRRKEWTDCRRTVLGRNQVSQSRARENLMANLIRSQNVLVRKTKIKNA